MNLYTITSAGVGLGIFEGNAHGMVVATLDRELPGGLRGMAPESFGANGDTSVGDRAQKHELHRTPAGRGRPRWKAAESSETAPASAR